MKSKPPINSCWGCGRKFRGAHSTVVLSHNGPVHIHKQCRAELERDGMLVEAEQVVATA